MQCAACAGVWRVFNLRGRVVERVDCAARNLKRIIFGTLRFPDNL